MAELRTQEQQLLSALESLGGTATVEQLIQACGFPDSAVMRNALTLQEKNFLSIHAKIQNIIKLTTEGETYAQNGLPERKLIQAVAELGGAADLKKAAEKAELELQFIQIALGWAIRKKWAIYTPQNNTLRITETLLHQTTIPEGCEETFLKHLNTKHQTTQEDLSPELQQATEQLKKRKLLTIEPKTTRTLRITTEGKKAVADSFTIRRQALQQQVTYTTTLAGAWATCLALDELQSIGVNRLQDLHKNW